MKRPLRIFLACQQSTHQHEVPAYSFWAESFRGALAEAGHECLEAPACDWAEGLLPLDHAAAAAWRERTWQQATDFLRRAHAQAPVDFFLGYLFPHQVEPAAVAAIRAVGIPCVNFFCDNVREFRRVPQEFGCFDLHWVPEHKAIALYARSRLPHLHAPMACWVPPALRTPVAHESLPVTFVGTRDELRERLFAEAITLGLRVDLRGTGWGSTAVPPPPPPRARNPFELLHRQFAFARQHGWPALLRKHTRPLRPIPPLVFDFGSHARPAPAADSYWSALRESSVCLGVNRYPSPRFSWPHFDSYSRLRDIEAPMAGACYLTEWTEGLDLLYDLGTEIETYRDAPELVEKTRALSADAPRRQHLRVNGQRRALRDHTIAGTISRIAEKLGCPR